MRRDCYFVLCTHHSDRRSEPAVQCPILSCLNAIIDTLMWLVQEKFNLENRKSSRVPIEILASTLPTRSATVGRVSSAAWDAFAYDCKIILSPLQPHGNIRVVSHSVFHVCCIWYVPKNNVSLSEAFGLFIQETNTCWGWLYITFSMVVLQRNSVHHSNSCGGFVCR